MTKRQLEDITVYEVDVPDGMAEEEIGEAFNCGDLEARELDGRIELVPAEARTRGDVEEDARRDITPGRVNG
jgi:hypothetical protein